MNPGGHRSIRANLHGGKPMRKKNYPAIRLEEELRSVLKLSEVAAHLGVTKSSLVSRIKRMPEWLELVRVGNLWYVRTDSLQRTLSTINKAGEK
jgi:hypothetical protein